jgi:hypothetical protein
VNFTSAADSAVRTVCAQKKLMGEVKTVRGNHVLLVEGNDNVRQLVSLFLRGKGRSVVKR